MVHRLALPLALVLLVVSLPAAAGDWKALSEKYLDRILLDLEVQDRCDHVDEVAAVDNRDAARLLLDSVLDLGGKVDRLRSEVVKQEMEAEKFIADDYKKKDKWERVDAIREEIKRIDGLVSADMSVLDRIRRGILRLEKADARGYVLVVAGKGANWYQRGMAAMAAATYPTDEGRAAAVKALKDREARVVIQALDGLIKREDPLTVKPIAACLLHDVWVIQSNAAKALASIGAKSAVRPLIEALLKTDGRVRGDINDALRKLTGEKFEPDYEVWKQWYEENKSKFEGEGGKPLKRGKKGKKHDPEDGSYYGIKTPSKRIVYVIDVSHSMLLEIGGGTSTPKPGEEEKATGPKIEIAKKELKTAIRKLPESAFFNIIVFNHKVKVWEKKMLKASQTNKNKAYLYIRALKAAGSTYTYGALREAFKLAGMGARDPNYAAGVDTIFLLSDGAPTDQSFPTSKLVDPEQILKAVRDWNQLHKVVIHAIAIDAVATKGTAFVRFMRELAKQNGGQYAERN